LGRLVKLIDGFNLGHNGFTGPIPTQLGNLRSLTSSFDLQHNNFGSGNGGIRHHGSSGNGKQQYLATIPSELGNLLSLRTLLMLNECGLKGPVPSQLGRLRDFEVSLARDSLVLLYRDFPISNVSLSAKEVIRWKI
jgi:hypothetical protein